MHLLLYYEMIRSFNIINQRLRRFDSEMSYKKRFEHHFVNDNLNEVILKIEKKIKENLK